MPTRRTTLIGLGVLSAGGAGVVATGAFSTATAERTVNTNFASNDTEAILAFQPTSDYASLSAGELEVGFQDLNTNANFTFEDTFIILNNGTETVSLQAIGSGDDDSDWHSETSGDPASVLVGDSANQWQGNPNTGSIDFNQVDASFDEGNNTDGGYFDPVNPIQSAPDLTPGDWISIGFKFGRSDNVGDWNLDQIPETVQFEFGQDS
jgi:hypothetical protein